MTQETDFKALVVSETDEPNLYRREIAHKKISHLPEGDLLIRVRYSSLNYKDALSASGHRGITAKYPHTPGIDASGDVIESKSDLFQAGDQVLVTGYDLGMNTAGGFAEYIRIPAAWAVKLPHGLTLMESMIYGTAGFTAGISIFKLTASGVKPEHGEILVTGASGGVGCMATALLAHLGFRVTAATGKEDQHQFLTDLGAHRVVHRDSIKDDALRPLLKGKWAGVVDTLGGEFLTAAVKSVAHNGTVACCGLVASPEFSLNVFPFILRGVTLTGVESAQFPMPSRLKIWDLLALQWKLSDTLLNKIHTSIPLEKLDPMMDLMLMGKTHGRILVNI